MHFETGLNNLSSDKAEGSLICLILCNNGMGIIIHFILQSGMLHQTTQQHFQTPPCLKDKWINRLMSSPACFFQKSHGMQAYIEHHILTATVHRTDMSMFQCYGMHFLNFFNGRPL